MDATAAETAVLVMTDVEGSTRLWREHPAGMNRAMGRHHAILHGIIARHGGWRPVDQGEGDSVFAAFGSARAAILAAAEVQRTLAIVEWPEGVELRVRIGIHSGDVIRRGGNLYGDTVNKCARIRALGAGGQTLLSAAVHAQVRDVPLEGMSFLDLGEHRMKDLDVPERIHQLQVAGLPDDFPPLRSLDRARHNLPVQTTSLLGRDADVATVRRLLAEHRLVTLVGFGGVGKTRLALQVAASYADGDGDGVWFVDLAPVGDATLVPAVIADALSITESGTGPEHAVLDDLTPKRLLLVLDNLERVLQCGPFLADLLGRAAGVTILATSRESLRIRGEQEYPVGTLATSDAVALFASRAAAVRPDFTVDGRVGDTVTAIAERLDGHPLALELAAARMKVLTADALLSRLSSALAVLTSGGRDRPERQQTLRATIAWSYDALDDDERWLLERLSVFPGSFTLDAVEAVCEAPPTDGDPRIDALDGITALVEKSLVRTLASDDPGREPRYDMLMSVREFAAEQLGPGDRLAELVRRHARFYGRLNGLDAESREEGAAIIGRAARELHNLRPAFEWAQRDGSAEDELKFSTFVLVLVDAGHFEEASNTARHALGRDPDASEGRVRMLSALGYLYWHTSQADLEREALEEQLATARRVGEPSLLASALIDTLQNCPTREDLLAQIAELDAVMPSLPVSGNAVARWYLEELLENRVSIVLRYADSARALASARAYFATTHFDQFVAGAMLTQLLLGLGEWDEAVQVLRQIDEYAGVRWSGDQVEEVSVTEDRRHGLLQGMWLRLVAVALVGKGELEQGTRQAEAAVEHVRGFELSHWLAVSELALASCYFAAGRLDEARERLESARDAENAGQSVALSVGWRLARIDRLQGRIDTARAGVDEALRALTGKELVALAELLGALVELAHHVVDDDPARAARVLGRVRRDREHFAIAYGAGDDVEPLLARVRERLGDAEVHAILADVAAQPPWSTDD